MPYRPSPDTASGMIVACHIVRRRTRRHGWASRAISSVAGYGGEDGRRVPEGPSPDRVPEGPSPDRVSSQRGPCRRPRCPCRVPGRAFRRPVVCHAPAQQRREPTPPAAIYEHVFFYMTVAFYCVSFGGAAKANRWAASRNAATDGRSSGQHQYTKDPSL